MQMDPQGDGSPDLDPHSDDAARSKAVPAKRSRGCQLERETLPTASAGKLPHKDAMAEPQSGNAGADTIKGPYSATPMKNSLASESEMANLGTSMTAVPLLVPQQLSYDFSGASFNIISDSQISDAQLSLVSAPSNGSVKGSEDHNNTVELPTRPSLLFSQACLRCAKCLDEEGI